MSIIIKGIDIHEKFESAGLVLERNKKDGAIRVINESSGEYIGSAIQIPTPHGRLIDVSELDKCWEEKEDISEDVDYKILYKCVLAISKYAPTILEAEE